MRVAICDDEKEQLFLTKTRLERAYVSLDLRIDTFGSGPDLICFLKESRQQDRFVSFGRISPSVS